MAQTDNPLKRLVLTDPKAFIEWATGIPVQTVQLRHTEFPEQASRADLLFWLVDQSGLPVLLHMEFQGRTSAEPMPMRELGYLSAIVRRELDVPDARSPIRFHSIVIYVGEGAGRRDNGIYTIFGLNDNLTLQWQYQVIRLWQLEATDLLAQQNPFLAALVGQTHLQEPTQTLTAAVAQIRQVAEPEQKGQLLTALVSLLPDQELVRMVEKLLEQSEELLLDTPYLQRMRQIGWEQGREQGFEEGREEGREDGMRRAIIAGIVRRFNPPASDYLQLVKQLEQIHTVVALEELLTALFDAPDLAHLAHQIQAYAQGNG